MIGAKIKGVSLSFVILVFSAVSVIAAFFGITAAWFTNEITNKMTGRIPVVAVKVYSQGLTKNDDIYVLSKQEQSNDALQTTLSCKSMSNIGVYMRAKLTCNWSELSSDSVFDVITFNLAEGWYNEIGNSSADNDNDMIKHGWLYYKSNDGAVVSDGYMKTLLQSITLSADMPDNLEIGIVAEVVQANKTGLEKFGNYPANWLD